MPIWQPTLTGANGLLVGSSPTDLLEACVAFHRTNFGTNPKGAATAPATWTLIGEHSDYFGGVVLSSNANWRTAVTVSKNREEIINAQVIDAEGNVEKHSIKTADVAARAHTHVKSHDDLGRPTISPQPEGGIAARLGGIAWTMIHKQMLSRDTKGLDITVISTIPAGVGLGENSATDVALALALYQESPEEAPIKARIAEICSQSAFMFSENSVLRARHTVALRGEPGQISVIDYADGSVTHAPHPVSRSAGLAAFVVAADTDSDPRRCQDIYARHCFLDEASRAFSVESLRLLPEAPTRVIEWLQAVIEVTGRNDLPEVEQAQQLLTLWEEETRRAQLTASALRSRRLAEFASLLTESQEALAATLDLSPTDVALSQLCLERGALAARSSSACGVIALVEAKHAHNFAADLSDDGLLVIPLGHGTPAEPA
ncbi:galactokinase family protein [Corynebacterium crudilactis]|uniref:Galactokinase n=1 Tax=Corynebacterium crudilactis TaxID=1652495 RepID=A0A172QUT3_9CORY|nr:galactokinase family protein [Corynebacterium crudilactis]ANE04469.1 galactokinase [Corynebacterium crudilactis]